ncbi:MAG: lysine exporter protein LysE/YggA [Parcubacteria group bacterium]|nr:lysine exporter protein LysE/YggA [Parcubacteria group bacterium]
MYVSQFFTIALIHLLAVVSPGPDFAMVSRNSLVYSRKAGIYTAFGLVCGIAVHITYSLLGIGLLISQSILLFNTIKYIGVAYLIYIGYKSLKAKPQAEGEVVEVISEEKMLTPLAAIKTGFLTNVLNPKVTLFILALFTQVIDPKTPKFIQALYGLEMMTATFVWFTIVSIFFSHQKIKGRVTKFQHWIERFTGVVLIGLGIKVALSSRR